MTEQGFFHLLEPGEPEPVSSIEEVKTTDGKMDIVIVDLPWSSLTGNPEDDEIRSALGEN